MSNLFDHRCEPVDEADMERIKADILERRARPDYDPDMQYVDEAMLGAIESGTLRKIAANHYEF